MKAGLCRGSSRQGKISARDLQDGAWNEEITKGGFALYFCYRTKTTVLPEATSGVLESWFSTAPNEVSDDSSLPSNPIRQNSGEASRPVRREGEHSSSGDSVIVLNASSLPYPNSSQSYRPPPGIETEHVSEYHDAFSSPLPNSATSSHHPMTMPGRMSPAEFARILRQYGQRQHGNRFFVVGEYDFEDATQRAVVLAKYYFGRNRFGLLFSEFDRNGRPLDGERPLILSAGIESERDFLRQRNRIHWEREYSPEARGSDGWSWLQNQLKNQWRFEHTVIDEERREEFQRFCSSRHRRASQNAALRDGMGSTRLEYTDSWSENTVRTQPETNIPRFLNSLGSEPWNVGREDLKRTFGDNAVKYWNFLKLLVELSEYEEDFDRAVGLVLQAAKERVMEEFTQKPTDRLVRLCKTEDVRKVIEHLQAHEVSNLRRSSIQYGWASFGNSARAE